ncbi:MAG: MobA/MobL family protein [Rhodoblastus sp.]|nr:MobA/MobL family protein [Rhodoblastus sp.]MCC0004709.1 MobA/MobL family protein [Methylobacteriaceae bacterium]
MAQKDPIAEAIKKETRMQARVAKQVARMKREITLFQPLKPYVSPSPRGTTLLRGLAAGIYKALDRPGVAPTTKPKSAAGAETFHFALTTVSKTSPFTRLLTGEREGSAAAHESYIEREDAPELFAQAQARFLEHAGPISSQRLPQDVDLAVQGQEYIERKTAIEAAARDGEGLSMYGNLPADYDSRLKFWEAVEAHEREPRTHLLSIDPGKDPETWARIFNDPAAPPELLAAAALPPREITVGKGDNQKTHQLLGQLKLTEARAPAVYEYLKSIKGSSKFCYWTPGRGGRIQMRLIISLPYELSADDRLALLKSFCDSQFRNLKADDGSKTDVPFWAVVHKPEATSDDRNYHAHIVFSERPARQILNPETGAQVWDFAYAKAARDSKRTLRIKYPFEQSKVRSLNDKGWPETARKAYAKLANDMLKARGHEKRLDPRSYKAMGIEVDPIQRMKPNEYAKEKKGQTSVSGEKTIDAQWQRITDSLDKRFPLKALFPPPAQQIRFDSEAVRWKTFDHPAHYMLIEARARWRNAWFKSRVLDADAAAAAVAIERIRSKYDAPGKSRLRDFPEVAEFLTAMADKYVAGPRIEAANLRLTQQQMIEYAEALTTARGPVIGDSMSQLLHGTVGSVHPQKIKMIDNLVALASGYTSLLQSGVDVTMDGYIATADTIRKQMPPAPQATPAPAAEPNYVTTPKPVKRYAPVPPGTKTPFKSTAGRVFGNVNELMFRARKITQTQQDKIRHYEWQKQDDAARDARLAAMNAEKSPRVTTSSLIDDRPYTPPKAQPAARPIPAQSTSQTPAPAPAPRAAPVQNTASRPALQTAAAHASKIPAGKAQTPQATQSQDKPLPEKAPAPPTPRTEPATTQTQQPAMPVAVPPPPARDVTAAKPEPSVTREIKRVVTEKAPVSSDRKPTPPATPQKTSAAPRASEPPPEPPRASQEQLDALKRRKRRRIAMFMQPTKDRGPSR